MAFESSGIPLQYTTLPSAKWYLCLKHISFTHSGASAQTQTSSCYVFGTQHVLTFDGERIDFNTDCQLTLARPCLASALVPLQFRISSINTYKYSTQDSVSEAQCMQLSYQEYAVKLCSDQTALVSVLLYRHANML